MLKIQCKNIVNNSQGNILSPEQRHATILSPEYFNISESQECFIKNKLMKVITVIEEKISESLKGFEERKINKVDEDNKSLKECQ